MISENPGHLLFQDIVANANPVEGRAADDSFISSAEFAAINASHDWLIEKTLVRHEPLILGGPKKSLKTSIVLDLAISLAGGFNTRFLGKFNIKQPYRVGLISGESGKATLKRKAQAICESKGLKLEDLPLLWRFRMPQFANFAQRDEIIEAVREHRLDVMIFDPMYLGLLTENTSANAGNVLQMGPLLQQVVDTCLPYNCTPVLVHHTKKLGPKDKVRPLDLDDLSQSGFAEFARQWILLSRRTDYQDGSGLHELWMRCGGSAGHSALWGVNVDEGQFSGGLTGSNWDVHLQTRKQISESKEAQKEQANKTVLASQVGRIVEYLVQHPEGDTKTGIREELKINGSKITAGLDEAMQQGVVEKGKVTKNNKTLDGYRPTAKCEAHPDNPDSQDGLDCPAGG
jgi:hypothetical protein